MATLKGDAHLIVTGVASNRNFALRTVDDQNNQADRATWELDAGATLTLFFKTWTNGAAPPGTANTVELRVYYETGTGTLIRTLHNAAPPADGTSFTFHGTDTGDAGGNPRCGVVRLYVRAIRTSTGTYDDDSDSNNTSGALRVRMADPSFAHDGYPSGAQHAYGVAGDENAGVTVTHTQRYADRNNETVRIDILDGTDVQVAGSEKEVGAGTTNQTAVVNTTNFDQALKSYGARFTIENNSLLLTGEKWTTFPDGTTTKDSATTLFDADPRITIGLPTLGESVYNRGEAATIDVGVTNSRGDALTRSMDWRVKDSGGAIVLSGSDTGPTYDLDGTIPATAKATYDLVGDQYTIEIDQTDSNTVSTDAYGVSRMWQLGKTDAAVDDGIKTGKTAGADDITSRNRGQTLHWDGFVYNVRGELLGTPTVNFNVRPIGSEAYEESNDTVALAAGRFQDSYTVDTDESTGDKAIVIASATTGGSNQPRTGTGGSGNFVESNTSTTEWSVTSTLTIESRTQKEATRNTDPEDTVFAIAVHLLYSYGQVLDSEGDVVEGASTTHTLIDPAGVNNDSGTSTTDAQGWAGPISFVPSPPEDDSWVARVSATWNGNSGQNDQTVKFTSPFAGNKITIIDLGPVHGVPNLDGDIPSAVDGDLGVPGDRIIVGFGLAVRDPITGTTSRVNITEATPRYALIMFDQDTAGAGANAGARVLQSDNETWLKNTDPGYEFHFRDFKEQIDQDMAWTAHHGAAAQGVTSSNGYPTTNGTSGWPSRRIYVLVEFNYNGAEFVQGAKNEFGHRPANEARKIIVAGAGNPSRAGTHWNPGEALIAEAGLGLVGTTFESVAYTAAGVAFLSEDPSTGQTLYLDSNLDWVVGSDAFIHTMSAHPADANKALFSLTSVQTETWPVRGVIVVFRLKDSNGRTYVVQVPLDVKDKKNQHDKYAFDGTDFATGFSSK